MHTLNVLLCLRVQTHKVALSTIESRYVAVLKAAKDMVCLHSFLEELDTNRDKGVCYNDGHSAIFLAQNLAFCSKTKHIQTKYHYLQHLEEG